MNDDQAIQIVPKRDLQLILQTEDMTAAKAALSEFLKDPAAPIAGALIELLAHGPAALAGPAVRIAVAALRRRALQQLAAEVEELKKKGKLADDFADRKYGLKTFVELLSIIDEEAPDEDRLDAMKAMFYTASSVTATEAQEIVAYQLFQIAKRLSSNDLLVLKIVFDLRLNASTPGNSYREWVQLISANSGDLRLPAGLIDLADQSLVDHRLLTERYDTAGSGSRPKALVDQNNLRLTDLGMKFCENIRNYQIEKKSLGQAVAAKAK